MSEAPNPFAAPAPGWEGGTGQRPSVAVGPELERLLVMKAGGTERWTVVLHEHHVRAVPEIGEELFSEREEFLRDASVFPGHKETLLFFRKPKRLSLLLSPDDVRRLVQWVGPDRKRWMAAELRRQARSGSVVGVGLLALGLLDASWPLIVLGVADLVHSVLQYTVPDRRLFVGHTIGAVLVAGVLTYQVV